MKHTMLILLAGCSLAGCATTSFAPPAVNLENEMSSVGSNRSIGQRCMPNQRLNDSNRPITLTEDVHGARRLIDNFVFMYRCRAHSAADGRQLFEIPSFLALAGAAAAGAFGAGADVAIAGGIGNSLFTSGGKYYAAQRKAEIFDHALDALLCIKAEAVGIDAFTVEAISGVEEASGKGAKAAKPAMAVVAAGGGAAQPDPEVTVSAKEQYYDMVAAALLSVERVTAQRLSSAGTPFDAAGVVAEIEALNKKVEDAKKDKGGAQQEATDLENTPVPPAPPAAGPAGGGGPSFAARFNAMTNQRNELIAARDTLIALPTTKIAETILNLRALQPELQRCVVRAKV